MPCKVRNKLARCKATVFSTDERASVQKAPKKTENQRVCFPLRNNRLVVVSFAPFLVSPPQNFCAIARAHYLELVAMLSSSRCQLFSRERIIRGRSPRPPAQRAESTPPLVSFVSIHTTLVWQHSEDAKGMPDDSTGCTPNHGRANPRAPRDTEDAAGPLPAPPGDSGPGKLSITFTSLAAPQMSLLTTLSFQPALATDTNPLP